MLKISTAQLADAGWNLSFDLQEARANGNVISLAESTCIRMIEEIAGVDARAVEIRLREVQTEIRQLRRQSRSREVILRLKGLYAEQQKLQYMPEYVCLVCTTKALFYRACRGFRINGILYGRLVGTTGGVKNSTVVFCADTARNGAPLLSELRRRIDNGRNPTKEFVPAKLEAYRALVCSASTPLSPPRGVLVVGDCVTHFLSDYISIQDSAVGDEPEMSVVRQGEMELIGSDGYGLMSPELAQRWGRELRLDYRPAGICLRNSFCKGMVFSFDFHEFAEDVAGSHVVKDIWGAEHDIGDVDLILTASMLKLWDSYASIDEYLWNCAYNGYCFSATKATPKELDTERRTNYQFLQSYDLSDEQIWELVRPTVEELSGVMGGDYAKALLFLLGTGVTEETVWPVDTPWVAALMADEQMMDDPYVRRQIKSMVKKKVTETKFGKLKVHGNFSVISGDPFALCQSIWGLPVRGLLKAGELYSRYWSDDGAKEVVCFRAPMSSKHNIRKMAVRSGWSVSHWYQYMDTVTVLNDWDMTTHALNGADKDGDLFFLTDNRVLLGNYQEVLPIQCEQKKAPKCVPGEKEFITANALGFGDDIGSITNRITAQTELLSLFEPGTAEYEELSQRIVCGQAIQQEAVDKIKGVVSKGMPRHWYDPKAAAASEDPIDARIVADKKPYFMIYRYPELMSRYKRFVQAAERKCLLRFRDTLDHVIHGAQSDPERADAQAWFYRLCPVQYGKGIMNRICGMCESYFSNQNAAGAKRDGFDYTILTSGTDCSRYMTEQIKTLYHEYMESLQAIGREAECEEEYTEWKRELRALFQERCAAVCPNEDELCDIVVLLCYGRESSKQFAWDMCGTVMVRNLLARCGGRIRYPKRDPKGGIFYGGRRFTLADRNVGQEEAKDEGYCIK